MKITPIKTKSIVKAVWWLSVKWTGAILALPYIYLGWQRHNENVVEIGVLMAATAMLCLWSDAIEDHRNRRQP